MWLLPLPSLRSGSARELLVEAARFAATISRMSEQNAKAPATRRPLPRWKKVLLVSSIVATVLGGGLHAYAYLRGSQGSTSRHTSTDPSKGGSSAGHLGVGGSSLVEGGATSFPGRDTSEGQTDAEESSSQPTDSLAPLLTKGGISFFLGFCMAYAIRTFFKISALFIGGAALLFFALQHFGLVPGIDWSQMDQKFQSVVTSVGQQLGNFKTFIEGHLPSSAAATAGMFTGWKRH